ncbi:FUSC family protein [Nocardia sp. NBC_00511]|uniref:FUSC family protein n=1 Tax=Nocardia sp. NBC_00511 TaxID=2903591 RepID=UPI0030E10E28
MSPVPYALPKSPPSTRLRALVFGLGPIWHRWRSGVRTAAAFGLSACALVAGGYPQYAMLAAFGAFAVMYGDGRPVRSRIGSVAGAAAGLLGGVAVGALLGHALAGRASLGTVAVVMLTVVAMTAVYVINAVRVGPPGALFFMTSASGAIAATGAGVRPEVVLGCAGLGAVGALLVTGIGVGIDLLRGDRSRAARQPAVLRRLRRSWTPDSHAVTTTVRVGVACAGAGAIALALNGLHPYWAMLTALVVLAQGPHRIGGRARAIHRFAGTAVGVVAFAGLYQLGLTGYALVGLVAALMFATELFVAANYGIAVLFITPLALFAGGAGTLGGSAGATIRDRLLETVIGVVAAVLCLSLVAPHALRRTLALEHRRMRGTARRVVVALDAPMDADGRMLCAKLRFDLKGCENAGIDCAHDDARWMHARWADHIDLVHRGHGLLAAAEAVPLGERLADTAAWRGVFDDEAWAAAPEVVESGS